MLTRPPEEISLLEVIEAIEGPMNADNSAAEGLDDSTQIKLRTALVEITETSRQQLEAIKFAQLLEPPTT
jgi:DNA-binding IscR family transcriptional regulator